MRKFFLIAAMAAMAGALASCDPTELVVRDARELRSVSLRASDDSETWAAGEVRVFTVEYEPADALVQGFWLEQPVQGMIELMPGGERNEFRVLARKAGQLKLTGVATDRGGIIRRDERSFTITGTYRPKMAVRLRETDELSYGRDFPKVLVCESGQLFDLAVFSDNPNVQQCAVSATDPDVLAVERMGPLSWRLLADEPGGVNLKVTMTDAVGEKQVKTFRVYVYGDVTLRTRVDLEQRMLGLAVISHIHEPCGARLSVDGSVYGWPEGHPNRKTTVPLNSLKDYVVLEDGYNEPELLDVRYPFEEIEGLLGFPGAPFEVRGADVLFGLELDNPYIRVERVYAVQDGGFLLTADFEQTGLEEQEEMPDTEADLLEPEDAAVGGWRDVLESGLPL